MYIFISFIKENVEESPNNRYINILIKFLCIFMEEHTIESPNQYIELSINTFNGTLYYINKRKCRNNLRINIKIFDELFFQKYGKNIK